jgi:hypothetical protein
MRASVHAYFAKSIWPMGLAISLGPLCVKKNEMCNIMVEQNVKPAD